MKTIITSGAVFFAVFSYFQAASKHLINKKAHESVKTLRKLVQVVGRSW